MEKNIKNYLQNTKDDWNYITPKDFYEKYYNKNERNKSNKSYFLIDLRKKTDYNKYHIRGAKNIFWLDLMNNLHKIPKNKKIFLICYVGHTSSQAMVLLKLLGYDVTSIKFGYGITPVKDIPVAGWINLLYPVVRTKIKRTKQTRKQMKQIKQIK
jgi:rhodanese-related sulfurtransferase